MGPPETHPEVEAEAVGHRLAEPQGEGEGVCEGVPGEEAEGEKDLPPEALTSMLAPLLREAPPRGEAVVEGVVVAQGEALGEAAALSEAPPL